MKRLFLVAALALFSCTDRADDAKPPEREADPLALPFAAVTRVLVRGEPLGDAAEERARFPHVDRYAWRTSSGTLSTAELDRAWRGALERIAASPRYSEMQGEGLPLPPPGEMDDEERLRMLERRLGFARDGRLVPLGPNRDTKLAVAPDPPEVDEGLEEFAVVGTGVIRMRHPVTDALGFEADQAMTLVLVPRSRLLSAVTSSRLNAPADAPRSETFPRALLVAKTEATTTQLTGDVGPISSLPKTEMEVDIARRALQQLGLRLPKLDELNYAASGGALVAYELKLFTDDADLARKAWYAVNSGDRAHKVGQLAPNAFGLFDTLGNVAELCEDPAQGLISTAGGSFRSDASAMKRSYLSSSNEERTPAIGVRPVRDVLPPPEPKAEFMPERAKK